MREFLSAQFKSRNLFAHSLGELRNDVIGTAEVILALQVTAATLIPIVDVPYWHATQKIF